MSAGTGEGQAVPDATTGQWSRRRRWTIGVTSVVVALGLLAFVPGPFLRAGHLQRAHALVDEVAAGRAELLAEQSKIRSPLESLGTPVRAWDEVRCWLKPRMSDGDGELDVVVDYQQACVLRAYEIYALPPDVSDATQAAARLRGRVVRIEPTCGQPIVGTLTPEYGASGADEYSAELWWVEPDSTPSSNQPERCTLPEPGATDTAHLETGVDEPLVAETYIVFSVRSPIQSVDVGCMRWFAWLGSCSVEPEGFPSLS